MEEIIKERGLEFCLNAIIIDFYLWDQAKEKTTELRAIPIHKTETIFY